MFRLRDQVKTTLENFDQIYSKQDNGEVFRHPADLWKSLNLLHLTETTFQQFSDTKLSKNSLLASELLAAVNRVNYNQGNQINALAGLVSMCPMVTGTVRLTFLSLFTLCSIAKLSFLTHECLWATTLFSSGVLDRGGQPRDSQANLQPMQRSNGDIR